MPQHRQLFSEAEVTEILKAAVRLEEDDASRHVYAPGVTAEELTRIAAEVGIDPQHLEEAIRRHSAGEGAVRETATEIERVVEGELDPDDFDVMFESLGKTSGRHPPVHQFGRTVRAQVMAGGGVVGLEVTSRNGRTRIRSTYTPAIQVMGTIYPASLAAIGTGIALATAGMPFLAAASALALLGGSIFAFKKWTRHSRKQQRELVERLAEWVAKHAKQEDATTPRLDERLAE